MSSQPFVRPRPGRWMAISLHLPVWAYRLGLGPRLAKRNIMMLHTTGRRSGLERVAGLSYALDGTTLYVAAGWGPRTDWYQNLLANPEVQVEIGAQRLPARGRPVTDETEHAKAIALLAAIDGGPPAAVRPFFKLLGFDFDKERAEAFADPSRLTLAALELAAPLVSPEEERPWDWARVPVFPLALLFGGLILTLLFRRKRRGS